MQDTARSDVQPFDSVAFASGDIVLFSGQSPFSYLIRTMTNSPWSHCGMVVCDARGKQGVQIWDVSKKIYGGAVGLYNLQERLDAYRGGIAYRPLFQNGKNRGLLPDDIAHFETIQTALAERPYERSHLELFKAAFDPKVFSYDLALNDPDSSSLFCAELIAETYQRLGILPHTLPANEYVPSDFAQDHQLPLQRGYELGAEITLKYQDGASDK